MPELLKSVLGSVLRKLLAGVGAWLVAQEYLTAGDWQELVAGLVLFAASVAWGIWEKYGRPVVNQLPR